MGSVWCVCCAATIVDSFGRLLGGTGRGRCPIQQQPLRAGYLEPSCSIRTLTSANLNGPKHNRLLAEGALPLTECFQQKHSRQQHTFSSSSSSGLALALVCAPLADLEQMERAIWEQLHVANMGRCKQLACASRPSELAHVHALRACCVC